jgi:hypothetical protein
MRLAAILLLSASLAAGQGISTKVLMPGAPMKIELSPQLTTTLLFPGPLSGTFGLGLVTGNANTGGSVQVDHPDGSNILVLHALSESAHVVMTVLLDGALYVFELQSGPTPDVALTLVKTDPTPPRAVEVTPQEVVEQRPRYDAELLIQFERLAKDAPVMRKLYPDLYQGYASRQADYTSDSGTVKTTVSTIHRFSREDAVVLEGSVINETDHPIQFDGRATTVLVSNEVYPAKLTDCIHRIPAGATVPIVVVIQGDTDGSRANLSIDNSFRIQLPGDAGTVWEWKNGDHSGKPFKIAPPVPNAPLTQATPKEGQ